MNDFLEQIKLYLKCDSTLINFNLVDFLYTQLISYNLGNNQEPFENKEKLFDEWIFRNKEHDNLKTFVSPKYPYFCQFVNKNAFDVSKDGIKLYIPLDSNHLYEGANRLFDFIEKNDIKHNSKIGKRIRNDNVVVRVSNIEEAEKVINYVKNDKYIQEGLLNINPFTINIDGVGIVKDGGRSYNWELCNSLGKFINILNANNRLFDLNMDSFHIYLEDMKQYGDKDIQEITNLQSIVTSGNKLSFEDFKKIVNQEYNQINSKEDYLKKAIIETYNKYGSISHIIHAIARFRYNGDASGFTRSNSVRYNLELNVTIDDVNDILSKFNSSEENIIEEYINEVLNVEKKDFKYLVNAYTEMYNKYGDRQAGAALEKYILNGATQYITRDNNSRDNLNSIDYENIYFILKEGLEVKEDCTLEELSDYFVKQMRELNRKNVYA